MAKALPWRIVLPWLFGIILSVATACSLAPREPAVRSAAAAPATHSYRSYVLVRAEKVSEAYRRLDFPDGEQAKLEIVAREVLGDRGVKEASVDSAETILYLAVGKRSSEGNASDQKAFGPMTAATDDTLTLDAFDAKTGDHLWHGRTLLRVQSDEVTPAEEEFRSLIAAWLDGRNEDTEAEVDEKVATEEDATSSKPMPADAKTPPGSGFEEVAEDTEEGPAEATEERGETKSVDDDEFSDEFADEFE